MTEVCLELFLADNALMGLLILRGAALLGNFRLRRGISALVLLGSSLFAAGAMLEPRLTALPFKMLLLLCMSLCLRSGGMVSFIKSIFCVLLSTLVMGGMAYALSFASWQGQLYSSLNLRLVICAALLATFIPGLLRWLTRRRALEEEWLMELKTDYGSARLYARLDTGNDLHSLAGEAVVVVDPVYKGLLPPEWSQKGWQESPPQGLRLIRYSTIDSGGLLPAVPARARVRLGEEWSRFHGCCVAMAPQKLRGCGALAGSDFMRGWEQESKNPSKKTARTGGGEGEGQQREQMAPEV